MGILEALRRSGVPPIDSRIMRTALDETLSIEARQSLLDDLYMLLDGEHDRAAISGEQESLEMRRRAREFNDV
jgi:hypothetical protein